jgi:uncharacterized protein YecT (DUF1311 family)
MPRCTPLALALLLMPLTLTALQAQATDAPDCRAPTTQSALAACAYEDFLASNAAQAEAQRLYAQRLGTADAQRWRKAQRAWIAWRTAQCDFASAHAGSARDMLRWQCTTRMTQARTRDIERLAQCAEGDLACPPRRP